jgi:hypothetical protein
VVRTLRPMRSPSPPPVLHQYTTHAGLVGILGGRKKALWATDVAAANDREELKYADDLVRAVLSGLTGRKAKTVAAALALREEAPTRCVACFSEEPDLLSQWRAYADGGKGYSIGFKTSALRGRGFRLERVIYDPAEQVLALLNMIAANPDPVLLRRAFDEFAPCLKDPHWYEEREWRLIRTLSQTSPVAIRNTRSGSSVVYVEIRIRRGDIGPIIVGPCHAAEAAALPAAINALLTGRVTRSIRVVPSRNSLR